MVLSRREEDFSRERAIATVVQGQNAENLLDFDDDPVDGEQPISMLPKSANGLGVLNGGLDPSAANVTSATNPLDDLLGLFDSSIGLTVHNPPNSLPHSVSNLPSSSAPLSHTGFNNSNNDDPFGLL